MNKLTPVQERLLKALYKLSRWSTTHEIAKDASISWNTANKNLELLFESDIVSKDTKDQRIIWKLTSKISGS